MSSLAKLGSGSGSGSTTMRSRATSTRLPLLIFLISCLLFSTATAQSSTTSATATSTATASLLPAPSGWSYVGCYNETTGTNGTEGQRALNGGVTEALDSMTATMCLSFCKSNAYPYAGIEYTRECYCSHFLSSLSAKLDETRCNLPCMGNSSQLCGGSLSLNVYTTKTSTKGAAVPIASQAPVGSILALVIASGVLLCLA